MTAPAAPTWTAEVVARYRAGGLGGSLTPRGRMAVVVVDLQYGFTDPACGPGFDLDHQIERTSALLAKARAAQVPVYFSTIAFTEEQQDCVWLEKMPVMRVLTAGSRWERIDERVAPQPGETVVAKQTASAFAGTDLADRLRTDGVGTVLLTGATTSGCVRATAVDSCAHNFVTYVVRDCVGDREAGPHEVALVDLDAKYADVIDLGAAVTLLGGQR